jgi:DNA-binding CsgD family transcriptional regulator
MTASAESWPPLLEREREMAAVEAQLLAVAAGEGGVLAFEAPAGTGKTRLLDAAGVQAETSGFTVLRARGFEIEAGLPWGLARRLLEPILPDSGPASPSRPTGPDAELETLHALTTALRGTAVRDRIALLVDDVHWSDDPSLRFLAYLALRLEEIPLALFLVARPGLSGGAWHALRSLDRVTVCSPEPLSPGAVKTLVEHGLGESEPGLAGRLTEMTGGNPLYLTRLLAILRERGAPAGLDGLGTYGRAAIAGDVLASLSAAGEDAARLAAAAAILGPQATPSIAARLGAISTEAALAAGDRLVALDVLSGVDPLTFRHPIIAAAVLGNLPAGRRAALHADAVLLLRESGARPARIAEQLLHAPADGEPLAVEILRAAAAEALEGGAPAAAVRYLRRAVEEPPPAGERTQVVLELAEARSMAGDAKAPDALREAIRQVAEDERRAGLEIRLGWALHRAGRFGEAADVFAGVRDETMDEDIRADARAGYLTAAMLDVDRAAAAGEQIGALLADARGGRRASERALLANTAVGQAFAGVQRVEVAALAERAFDGGRMLEDYDGSTHALWHVVGCLSWCDRFERALEIADEAAASDRRRGSIGGYATACYARAWPLLWTGRVDSAVDQAEAAIEVWKGGAPMYLPAAAFWLVRGLIAQGRIEEATAVFASLRAEEWAGTAFAGFLDAAAASLHAARGEHRAALERWLACGELALRMQILNPSVMPWRSEAAIAAAMVADPRAVELADDAVRLSDRFGAPRARGVALRAAGVVRGGEEGIALLEESTALLAESGAHLERALSLLHLGGAMRRARRPREARARLHEAHDLVSGSGATGLAEEIAAELRAAGGRLRTSDGGDVLTAAERRVAELAARGLSNREIAGALFVTVKTVEWHLSGVFRKLDISRRVELAARLKMTAAPEEPGPASSQRPAAAG